MKRLLALLFATTLLLAACGDDNTSTGDTSTTAAGDTTTTGAPVDVPAGATITSVTDNLEEKPTVDLEPSDTAPTELVTDDVVEGDGDEVTAGDTVSVQYVGLLTDGTEFDSSWDRGQPAEFPLDGVIQGWGEGLVGMKVGGRRSLVIPSDLAYGDTGQPPTIPGGATLVFVVDLLSVTKAPTPGVEVGTVSDNLDEKPTIELTPADEAPTEILVRDIVEGDGDTVVGDEDPRVRIHLVEQLTNGQELTSTWELEPVEFNLSQVIPGFTEGLDGMKVGGRRLLVLPADQAYGASGTGDGIVPPDATLVYVVDLLEIVDPTATTSTTAGP